ncbi:MAG: TIGR04053 family radical SAM/SPASM domain-containing protein [Verrucomicrobiota bacterium]|jgi:radical SAM protein|nr:TIGR04053 family radical SAM/SPASM domain-containing protein [Verrucomicrobiota bacterium]MDD8050409.1 TIGR04053 family radical SAM/SPASM domain-containing protein [Verrucomicrobiota bacterium]HCF94468.1 radical SAM/SPASM domain-containing protein [Verrucomicrobiota bacterium]
MARIIRRPKMDPAQRPFMIVWETTQACDLACKHCRAAAQPNLDPNSLNFEEAKNLLNQSAEFGRPSPIFIFTGGDPFKRPDLFELVRYADEIGLAAAVSPSGTPLLNRQNLIRLKEAGTKAISLSIDASNATDHDLFRQVPGSFTRTIEGWKMAREIGLKLQVNTTLTRYNLDDLAKLFGLVQELGAMTWSLFFLVPTGRGQEADEVTPAEYEAVMHFLYDVSKYIPAKTTEGHHYKRVVIQRAILEEKGLPMSDFFQLPPVYRRLTAELDALVAERGLTARPAIRRTPMHINSGNGFVFISHLGEVFPSGFLPVCAGNVKERSLVDIYRDSSVMQALRDPKRLQGRCGLCEFSGICGGSRSRAYAMSGDFLAEEPFCTYEPGSFPFQDEVEAKLAEMRSYSES